jgi:hypothetical protein
MRGSVRKELIYVVATVSAALPLLAGGASATATNRPLRPPEVRTGKALEVHGTYVVLQGWIDPRGQVTTYHFELGTTASYGISPELNDEHPMPGYRSEQVLEAIPQLRPRSTYHFRLVAHSRGGTTYGKDKTFRTHRSN